MKITLCAIAKNENRYIKEWVDYHLNIGFDNIIIFDNNTLDGEKISDVINGYDNVTVCDKRGIIVNIQPFCGKDMTSLQGQCYSEAYINNPYNADWIAYWDIDEFIDLPKGLDIKQYLSQEKFSKNDGIHISWKLYGDNGHVYYEPGSVISRFKNENNMMFGLFYKTIIRTGKGNIRFHAHGPAGDDYKKLNITDINGYKSRSDQHDDIIQKNNDCYLLHFITKSTEEYFSRKYKMTSAVIGEKSPINNNLDKLLRSSTDPFQFGYFSINKRTNEKMAAINKIIESRR